ncbi:hypothetical protein Bca52824_067032 [Brassica carinata]|uniref:Glycerol-3-phosphate dehydrogenase [NAD(+)] n=1 Tax=Brassica carinata TaxID=52824 RepID=A0A8X7UBC2_BRACI|nr:hypothetical protein Bca52824_067032 [Brassica carinata]
MMEHLVETTNDKDSASPSRLVEARLDEIRRLIGKADDDPLKIVGVGAGAWGSVFIAMLQENYGTFRDKVSVRIWRRGGRAIDKCTAQHLFEVINSREELLRRLIRRCAYLKYVEARLGDRVLYADEILKDGFCLNMIETPLCPLKVVTNLQEAVWDADVVVNGLPSTETFQVFSEISKYWKERVTAPVIISLAKGVEAEFEPHPRIVTPTQMIYRATGIPLENILYLGGPNIASEVYNKEYANARICGSEKWRKPLGKFLRQSHFIVWDNSDLVTHEVMGGLKNVYAIGAGMVDTLTKESATSKSVYFAHCTSEMIFITHLLAKEPEKLAGPLLADTYVTLLKGRNAWYGQKLAKGELNLQMGDSIKGKGMIQGVSAVKAFFELLNQSSLSLQHPEEGRPVTPAELCPILKMLYRILITREFSCEAVLEALRDETMNDPRELIEIAHSHLFFQPSLLESSSYHLLKLVKLIYPLHRSQYQYHDKCTAQHLFEVINSREELLRRLIRRCAYLKYVEARLGDRVLYADEILKDGFCLNMIETPLCPLKVVTNLQEAVWDADVVVNGLPSTETFQVFSEISKYWKERVTAPVIISLAKGVEAEFEPHPRIVTPTQMIYRATGIPLENILYLGDLTLLPRCTTKSTNARICGSEKWRKPLGKFLRQSHFIVWDNSDLVTHEVMGGLKNVYAIGAGMVDTLTKESATSKSVYFAHCTSEMIFITHLLAKEPEKLAGPLLADTYVTLLKGRNAWYGQKLAKGELNLQMGDSIKGKGMIQGVSAVKAFFELLNQSSLSLQHPEEDKPVTPAELCPILKMLYRILITREVSCEAVLEALRDETMNDPRELIEIAHSHLFFQPSLLGQKP